MLLLEHDENYLTVAAPAASKILIHLCCMAVWASVKNLFNDMLIKISTPPILLKASLCRKYLIRIDEENLNYSRKPST